METTELADNHRRFVWYELMTTDVAGARAFYTEVIGWRARDVSAPNFPYTVLASGDVEIAGDFRNEPAHVALTANYLAQLRKISLEELAAQTTANFQRLFPFTAPSKS